MQKPIIIDTLEESQGLWDWELDEADEQALDEIEHHFLEDITAESL